ncbi:MAG: redoxin domain-containing protein [Planctomycetes bacterium]|nr:redoxin domain-containing protein [Planctomycetota bacterium]
MKGLEIAYYTASCDAVEKNAEFAKSLKLDYPILSDPSGETARAYGVYQSLGGFAQRVTFLIDKDGRIAHIDNKVQVGSHGKDIVKKLDELGIAAKKQ